jgi:hypothetical protein
MRVLNSNDQIRITKFNYQQLTAARNYWEREKIDDYDMKLFIQLIATECLKDVADILGSYFLSKGNEERDYVYREMENEIYSSSYVDYVIIGDHSPCPTHQRSRQ